MTRFEQELSGVLGGFWKAEAEKELRRISDDLKNGKITIDGCGVARNCIGRVLMDDMLEKLAMVTCKVNIEATKRARAEYVAESLKAYRDTVSSEEYSEMRSAFGEGQTVINVLTGRKYRT